MERYCRHKCAQKSILPPFSSSDNCATTMCGVASLVQSQEFPAPLGNPPEGSDYMIIVINHTGSYGRQEHRTSCRCCTRCAGRLALPYVALTPKPEASITSPWQGNICERGSNKCSRQIICINARIKLLLASLATGIYRSTSYGGEMDGRTVRTSRRTHICSGIQKHIPLHGTIGWCINIRCNPVQSSYFRLRLRTIIDSVTVTGVTVA